MRLGGQLGSFGLGYFVLGEFDVSFFPGDFAHFTLYLKQLDQTTLYIKQQDLIDLER